MSAQDSAGIAQLLLAAAAIVASHLRHLPQENDVLARSGKPPDGRFDHRQEGVGSLLIRRP